MTASLPLSPAPPDVDGAAYKNPAALTGTLSRLKQPASKRYIFLEASSLGGHEPLTNSSQITLLKDL